MFSRKNTISKIAVSFTVKIGWIILEEFTGKL